MPEVPPAADPAAPPVTDPAAPPVPPVPPEPATPPAPETDEAKIARLEADLKKANAEAGKARITAKQTAADEARQELAKQVGKALGLIPDDVTDPAKLLEQATTSAAQAKQATVELAVFRAADAAGGDPIALLDSRTFLAKAAEIDPTDSAALAAAITEAVKENPRLGKTAAPGAPTMKPNPAQGSSASGPLGLDAQIAAAEKAGDFRTAIRLKAAKSLTPSP